MQREHHRWFSPTLGRDMDLLLFGHGGAKVVVFPTSKGRYFEWEDRGMMWSLREHLDRGWLQICCVDSVDAESWYAYHLHPGARAWRHELYDRYVVNEVLPMMQSRNPNPFVISMGASFGGYHALNFALKHPEIVRRVLCLSGICDIREFVPDYHNDTIYFNNPVEFIANENDPRRLAVLQSQDIVLAIGRDDRLFGTNRAMSDVLWKKGIWHAFRPWDGWSHDWPYWQKMMHLYISGHD
jgi:esterase/lipase superfamily enzyme